MSERPAGLDEDNEFIDNEDVSEQDVSTALETVPMAELTSGIQALLLRQKYICRICLAFIRRFDTLWGCDACFSIFHQACIRKWIRISSAAPQINLSSSSGSALASQSIQRTQLTQNVDGIIQSVQFKWSCPHCRAQFADNRLPRDTCWCGRFFDPPIPSPHEVTHSCGMPCLRKKPHKSPDEGCQESLEINVCQHSCPLSCHPGPCPPCIVALEDCRCICGKRSRVARCADALEPWRCEEMCGKALNCGVHKCKLVCHSKECAKCTVVNEVSCLCKKELRRVVCGSSEPPKCSQKCDKYHSCGIHVCEIVCHASRSNDVSQISSAKAEASTQYCDLICPRDPAIATRCGCGKKTILSDIVGIQRSCSDLLPSCGMTCDKHLVCGHQCEEVCHDGPCPQCVKALTQSCRCGRETRIIACSTSSSDKSQCSDFKGSNFRCSLVCSQLMSCGKHRCRAVCCPSFTLGAETDSHLCLATCGKPLQCGLHTCDMFCHLGKCQPCPIVLRPPIVCSCGKTVSYSPLSCGKEPPECSTVCDKILPRCGHRCLAKCHHGECPDCVTLVDKPCAGGHTIRENVQCWIKSSQIPCRFVCNKVLQPCGIHLCRRQCHSDGCGACQEPCSKRREFCEHNCMVPCHPNAGCPDLPCKAAVVVNCACQRLMQQIPCGVFSQQQNQCREVLPCDKLCAESQRRNQLASAFSDAIQQPKLSDVYDEELVIWGREFKRSLVDVEKGLTDVVIGVSDCFYTSNYGWEDLQFLDNYIQTHWRLEVHKERDSKARRNHLMITRDRSNRRIPSPILSDVVVRNLSVLSNISKPLESFIESNVMRFGFNSFFIVRAKVSSEKSMRDIIRRIQPFDQKCRLRFTSAVSHAPQTLIRKQQQRSRFIDHESPPKQHVPSNLGLAEYHLYVEAMDEYFGQKILELLNQYPPIGETSLMGHPKQKHPVVEEKEPDGWTTVTRKKK